MVYKYLKVNIIKVEFIEFKIIAIKDMMCSCGTT